MENNKGVLKTAGEIAEKLKENEPIEVRGDYGIEYMETKAFAEFLLAIGGGGGGIDVDTVIDILKTRDDFVQTINGEKANENGDVSISKMPYVNTNYLDDVIKNWNDPKFKECLNNWYHVYGMTRINISDFTLRKGFADNIVPNKSYMHVIGINGTGSSTGEGSGQNIQIAYPAFTRLKDYTDYKLLVRFYSDIDDVLTPWTPLGVDTYKHDIMITGQQSSIPLFAVCFSYTCNTPTPLTNEDTVHTLSSMLYNEGYNFDDDWTFLPATGVMNIGATKPDIVMGITNSMMGPAMVIGSRWGNNGLECDPIEAFSDELFVSDKVTKIV